MGRKLCKLNTHLAALLLAVVLVLSLAPQGHAETLSGTCGDGLSWTLAGDTLIISGSGAMYDFPESTMAPWYESREQITRLVLPEGLTRVGDLAFYDCVNLRSVALPDSVESVGWYAFAKCGSMTMLTLGDGLRRIEEAAFRECASLAAVRLPESLTAMEFQAFYRCESLTEITIPDSVTELGRTTFAYCYDLVRADVRASIASLPEWTFYGCARLADVSLPASVTGSEEYAFYDCASLSNLAYSGSAENLARIQADIARDLAGISVGSGALEESSSSMTVEETDTDTTGKTVTVTRTEHAVISSKESVTFPKENVENFVTSAAVTITIESNEGWSEVTEQLQQTVNSSTTGTSVDIYLLNGVTVPEDALDALAGQDATVNFHTQSGADWQVECAGLEAPGAADLSYARTDASLAQTELLGGAAGYQVTFANDAQINAEVQLQLPAEHARQYAYLYRVDGGALTKLQAAVVDDQGVAHFFLASVEREAEYLLGINVPGETGSDAIIPAELYAEYGITGTAGGQEYVITGIKSSWNMDITQVTWIMAAVLIGCVVIVGVTLYLLNKRKLKKGYVPDLDEYEI